MTFLFIYYVHIIRNRQIVITIVLRSRYCVKCALLIYKLLTAFNFNWHDQSDIIPKNLSLKKKLKKGRQIHAN